MTWLSKTIESNNIEQLEKDFGSYPPYPLKSKIIKIPFNIIHLNWITIRLYKAKYILNAIVKDEQKLKNNNSIEIKKIYNKEIKPQIEETKSSFNNAKKAFKKLNIFSKIFFILITTVISPALILIFAIYSLFILRKPTLSIISNSKNKESLGFYVHETGLDSEINLNIKLIKKSKANLESIISHEHLHLLQNQNRAKGDITEEQNIFLSKAEILIKDTSDSHLKYLLGRNECEARLHEMMLSFYRKNTTLPTTYNEFLGALLCCDTLCGFFKKVFIKENSKEEYPQYEQFKIRDESTMDDFIDIIIGIKDDLLVKERFAKEVLPVMYSSLLLYYGDTTASKKMLDSIPNTAMYDHLYSQSPNNDN